MAIRAGSFVTDQEQGLYFWNLGADTKTGAPAVQFSSHPHPLLPRYCKTHRWYSDRKCPAHGRKKAQHANPNVAWKGMF
jgi:hypothetical protein